MGAYLVAIEILLQAGVRSHSTDIDAELVGEAAPEPRGLQEGVHLAKDAAFPGLQQAHRDAEAFDASILRGVSVGVPGEIPLDVPRRSGEDDFFELPLV